MATKLFDSTIISEAQEAMDFMANVLEASTAYSIIGKDLDGKILLWNEGARRMYGYEPAEVVDKANSSIAHSAEDVARIPGIARCAAHKNPRLQRRGNMNQRKSLEPALIAVLLSIVFTLIFASSSWAQSPVRRIAVFTPGLTFDHVFRGLQEGLVRLGYTEGENITFIVEDTKGSSSELVPRAQKLLTDKPDVVFAVTTGHALAAKQATTTVPIVFAYVRDPVEAGLVSSFSSSKNNLTGVMTGADSLSGKRLEVLLEVAPKVKRLLVIVAPKESVALSSFRFLEETAKKLGVQLVRRDVTTKEEIEMALREMAKGSVDAIYYIPSTLVVTYVSLLVEKAKADKIPMVVPEDSLAAKGALVSYGANFRSAGVQVARLVAKVLKGEKPSEIPSEVPEKLMLAINLSTAKRIGLRISPAVLERAELLLE